MKLNELGHPGYLTGKNAPSIPCSKAAEEVSFQIHDMQGMIVEWKKEVSDLQNHYTWLLYFSVPKLLLLHSLINSSSEDEIVDEVSFLVNNQSLKRDDVCAGVKV